MASYGPTKRLCGGPNEATGLTRANAPSAPSCARRAGVVTNRTAARKMARAILTDVSCAFIRTTDFNMQGSVEVLFASKLPRVALFRDAAVERTFVNACETNTCSEPFTKSINRKS